MTMRAQMLDKVLTTELTHEPMSQLHHAHDLIRSSEAAEILGVSRATFNRRVLAGDIVAALTLPGATSPRLFDRTTITQLAKEAQS